MRSKQEKGIPEADVEGLGIAVPILADYIFQPIQVGRRTQKPVHLVLRLTATGFHVIKSKGQRAAGTSVPPTKDA